MKIEGSFPLGFEFHVLARLADDAVHSLLVTRDDEGSSWCSHDDNNRLVLTSIDANKERSIWSPCRNPLRNGSLQRPDVESVSSATCICIWEPSSSSGRGTADNKYLMSYKTYIARRKDCWFRLRSKDNKPSKPNEYKLDHVINQLFF